MNVVICTHGRCELIGRTLDSLSKARRPEGFECVWVIENGSDSGTRNVCKRVAAHLPLEYIHLKEQGKSRALQYALDRIGNGLVVFTDDDVRVNEGIFQAYAQAAFEHGPDAFFGGPLQIDYQRPPPDWLLSSLPPSVTGWQLNDPDKTIKKACFLGANYGAFVERINKAGGFKTHLGIGSQGNPIGEEFEIQDRLLAEGCRGVYVPDAVVWHYVPRERCTSRWTLRRHERIWFTSALMGQQKYTGRRLWNVPLWMWQRLVTLRLKAMAANCIPNAQKRFDVQKVYYQWRGTVRGEKQRYMKAVRQERVIHG